MRFSTLSFSAVVAASLIASSDLVSASSNIELENVRIFLWLCVTSNVCLRNGLPCLIFFPILLFFWSPFLMITGRNCKRWISPKTEEGQKGRRRRKESSKESKESKERNYIRFNGFLHCRSPRWRKCLSRKEGRDSKCAMRDRSSEPDG